MKKLLIAFVVSMLASCSLCQATDVTTQKTTKVNTAVQQALKVSNDGFNAMRAIRAARVAIFNAEPKVAIDILGKAKDALDAASKDESQFVSDVKSLTGTEAAKSAKWTAADWIPIDGQISLADTYVATPEKKTHVEKANEHLKNGRSKEAIEELRLGKIDVNFTRIMMSLSATRQCVTDAMQLAEEQKYYEANLALKAAEDAVIVDSLSLAETPKFKGETKAEPEQKLPTDMKTK